MTLYSNYLAEIEKRKNDGLNPKPIENGELLKEIISQIKDKNNVHNAIIERLTAITRIDLIMVIIIIIPLLIRGITLVITMERTVMVLSIVVT